MSRITKDIAHEVARKLTSKKTEEINKIEKELQLKLEGFLLEKVPKEIMDLFKKHPNYFEKTSSFRISGNGFNYEYLQTKNSIPYCGNNSFTPTAEQAKPLMELNNKITDLKKKKSELFREIQNLLYNLRTYSKVISEFPEAEPFLPKTITNKLIVNISDIRNQLK